MNYLHVSGRLLALVVLFAAVIPALADAPLLQFRPVSDPASSDSEKVTWKHERATKAETLALDSTVLFDHTGVESATIGKHPDGGPSIQITLTEAARMRWAEFTTKKTGKRVAILVNGRVISAPGIKGPLLGPKLELAGNMTDAEAIELANKLNSHPPK